MSGSVFCVRILSGKSTPQLRGPMPYLLKHHFDPDLDHSKPTPRQQDDGSVDHYELDFIQNVEAGAPIAEWIEVDGENAAKADPRFIFDQKVFPAGKGTGFRKKTPDILYAAVSGAVIYEDGKIVVNSSLTLPSDIDFHTGNLDFIGKLTIGGSVRTGFNINGRSVTVQGQIEGARVEALETVNCRGGIKGGKTAFIEAGHSIKTSFCEFGTLKAGKDVLVKGALMHSEVYAGSRLAVGGRLTGGIYFSHDQIYVGEQLGGGLGTDTSLVLGYDPKLLYADGQYNSRIKSLMEEIATYEKLLKKSDDHRLEYGPILEAALRELHLLKRLKTKLWEGIKRSERIADCKVLVMGVVNPGVEVSIGSAFLKVDDYLEDVYFYYDNNEVKIGPTAKKLSN